MASEFQIVHERVIITKYIEPVGDSDVNQMVTQLDAYARNAPQTILAIADFAGVKQFPSSLLSVGVRNGNINPVRNPKIASIIVITDSAFLASVATAISRITGANKIVFMRTRAEVDAAIEAFVNSDTYEVQAH